MSITDGGRSRATMDGTTGKGRPDDALRAARPRANGAALPRTVAMGSLPVRTSPSSWARNLASQDWLMVGYLLTLLGALALGKGPNRGPCIARVLADLAVFLFIVALVRANLLRWRSSAASLVYRTAVIGALLSSFFQLRDILPAVSPWTDDARIYAFDLQVFGFEPSVVLDRYVTPATTEWFAFFYFLYFLILSVHVLPMVYWQRDVDLLGRFATGLLLIFCVAHVLYMIVPGFGPYWYLKATFRHDLTGGTFWRLVREAVEAGGAQKDIFPSLHTAAPTYFAIFAFRHRRRFPFKLWWPVIAFLATQIIIATMFLRWHYLIDVIAGVALASAASLVGQRIADWERAKRERLGLQPAWTPLVYPFGRAHDD
jgi:PAP2 superfamily